MQAPPARVGKYRVLFRLAAGGMATVYLARALGPMGFERLVALKIPHRHLDIDAWKDSLAAEARLASRIAHPNVVRILDVDEHSEAGVFLVMEYVEGASLGGLLHALELRGERLPIPIAVRILVDMLAGLHAAHELRGEDGVPLSIIHRDVSPQNVLVGIDGVARLTDFGIAKAANTPQLTATGLLKGKTSYMSPEQIRDHAVDRRADVWAAGVVAWELFAGERLFSRSNDAAVLHAILSSPPRKLSDARPDIAPDLEMAVAGALATEPSARYGSAQAFSNRLLAAWDDLASREEVGRYVQRIKQDTLTEIRQRVELTTSALMADGKTASTRARAYRWALGALAIVVSASTGFALTRRTTDDPTRQGTGTTDSAAAARPIASDPSRTASNERAPAPPASAGSVAGAPTDVQPLPASTEGRESPYASASTATTKVRVERAPASSHRGLPTTPHRKDPTHGAHPKPAASPVQPLHPNPYDGK